MIGPMVSVCMPVYNNASYIAEAIRSVLGQQFDDFEILIIDDCSTDRTAEIAGEFAARDRRIRFSTNPENLGMVANWNRCLELSCGRYIKFLFGDDLLSAPDALVKSVAALEGTPEAVLVASARTIVDEQSRELNVLSHFSDGFTLDGREAIRRCLRRITREHNLIGEPTAVMFRRDAAGRGFDLRYRQLVDLEMWFHILEQGKFVYLADPLCSFRDHDGQQTKKNETELNFIDDLTYLFDDYLGKSYVGIDRLARAYLRYYQFYKLVKHARQGQHDMVLVRDKLGRLYGEWRFILLRPFYRIYTPYWQLKRFIARSCEKD